MKDIPDSELPPATPPIEIPVSRGELMLILSGNKHAHYYAHLSAIEKGDTVHFTWGSGDTKITIPVQVLTAQVNTMNRPLKRDELIQAGLVTDKPQAPRPLTRTAEKRQKFHPERIAAQAILREAHPKHPQEIYLRDLPGCDALTPVQQLTFRLRLGTDLVSFKQLERLKRHYENAYLSLAAPVSEAHGFHFNAQPDPENLPIPPDDKSLLTGMRFLASQKRSNLKELLAAMRAPYELLSAYRRGFDQPSNTSYIATSTHVETDLFRVSNYPELHGRPIIPTTIGRGGLMAMGAITHVATLTPLTIAADKTEQLAVLEANASSHYRNGNTARLFDLPVMLSQPATISARDVTDAQAKQHGYVSAQNMRNALHIKPGTNPLIHTYPARLALPHEINAKEAFGLIALETILNRVNAVWRSGGDSVKRAETFLKQNFPHQYQRYLDVICATNELRETQRGLQLGNVPREIIREALLPLPPQGTPMPSPSPEKQIRSRREDGWRKRVNSKNSEVIPFEPPHEGNDAYDDDAWVNRAHALGKQGTARGRFND